MELKLDKQGSLYEQIARAMKRAILEGRLPAGSKLPSTRALAVALHVSRKSVIEAYELLSVEQLTTARGGSGTRVANVRPAPPRGRGPATSRPTSRYVARMRTLGPITLGSRPGLTYSLHLGEPVVNPTLFNSWRRKLAAAALRAGPKYPSPVGFPPLRRAIADYLGRRRGLICDASDILIVGGTQQALTIATRVLVDNRDSVVVEDPHYQMAVHALIAHGARVHGVRCDDSGLVVRELPQRPVRMIYVTPTHQFPSGSILSLARRLELLDWANQNDSWIFEDDYDSEFHSGKRPIPTLRSLDLADRVIYAGTFSKTLFPSLRIGYLVCPKRLRRDLFNTKLLDDNGSATIEQAALATFIESRQYDKHLRKTVVELARRRRAVVDTLKRLLGSRVAIGPHEGGMHLVVWLPEFSFRALNELIKLAATRSLGLYPVHPYYLTRPARPGLLIGFAGHSSAQLKTAIELLVDCFKSVLAEGL